MESPKNKNSTEKVQFVHRTPKRSRHRRSSSEWDTPTSATGSTRETRRLSFLTTPVRMNTYGTYSGQDAKRDLDVSLRQGNEDDDDNDDDNEEEEDDNNQQTLLLSASSNKISFQSPKTPRTRTNEMFLSPSPHLKSPSGHISKDPVKPISEISQNLKTRLNYAYMKYQNGWSDKTINELEQELNVVSGTGYINKFAVDAGDHVEKVADESAESSKYSNKYHHKVNDNDTSAHWALLQALSERKNENKDRVQENSEDSGHESSVGKDTGKLNVTPFAPDADRPIEKVAVETLISLASPAKGKEKEDEETEVESGSDNE